MPCYSARRASGIAIKSGLGRLELAVPIEDVLEAAITTGFEEVPVRASVALRVAALALHHRDPFDRILVAQAMNEPATLVTADPVLVQYTDLVLLVAR